MLPTPDDLHEARDRIRGLARRTPLIRLDAPDAPAEIWLKLECLQPIGSFKIRGAANAMGQIAAADLARGVVTASAGNMAQGVAWCASARRIPCTVIAPDTAPAAKLSAIERLGARIIQVPFDRWWQTFQERRYPGVAGTFIHAFDDPRVMAGNGTIGLEILEDLPDAENRVILDAKGRIQLLYRPNNLKAHRMLVKEMRRVLYRLGFWIVMTHSHGAKNTTHQCGTVVFGDNPRTSVLDPFCRAHDVENLFVVDASFFPSSAAVNPALTIAAQALRVADHIRTADLKVGTTSAGVRSADL